MGGWEGVKRVILGARWMVQSVVIYQETGHKFPGYRNYYHKNNLLIQTLYRFFGVCLYVVSSVDEFWVALLEIQTSVLTFLQKLLSRVFQEEKT